MKKILILCLVLSAVTNLVAQKAIELNWSLAYGYRNPGSSLALTYYHSNTWRSGMAFRANYLSSRNDRIGKGVQTIQLDILERYKIINTNSLFIFVEIGISGTAINEWIGEYLLNCKASFCGHNSYLNSQLVDDYSWNNKHYKRSFAPGLVSGVGMGSPLTKRINVALMFRFGGYYWLANEEVLPYINYGLKVGYSLE